MNAKLEQIYALIKMGRPFVLVAGIIAYFVGLSMAYYELNTINLTKAIFGFLILMSGTLMGHYANEYSDVDTDSITKRTPYSGGSGVLPLGLVPLSWALYSAVFFLFLTLIITFTVVYTGILPSMIFWIVLPALFGGWFYSMPPFSLERKGLGELDNAILGGFCMTLIAYTAQTNEITINSLLSLIPIFLVVFVNLLGVHWFDKFADESVGKITLVVRLGTNTRFLFYIIVFLMYFITLLFMDNILPTKVGIIILSTIPFGIYSAFKFTKTSTPMLSSFLMTIVMFAMIFGYLIS